MTRRFPRLKNLCYAPNMDVHATHWGIFDFSSFSDGVLEDAYRKAMEHLPLPHPQRVRSAARSHWAGRIVLRHLLESQQIRGRIQVHAEFGYPFSNHCHVSIAHTEEVAVAAISHAPVGIDLEKKNRPVRGVLEKLVTPDELEQFQLKRWVDTHGIVEPELFLWVGKEAVMKASGLGLSGGLRRVQIQWDQGSPFPVRQDLSGPLLLKNPHLDFFSVDDCLIAICHQNTVLNAQPTRVTIED